MDFYYVKIFLTPFLAFAITVVVMKCCFKRWCYKLSSGRQPRHQNTSVYIIPFPVNDDHPDRGSLSSVATFAPPAYDSISYGIPPPLYSQQKISSVDEEPPAYSEIVQQPSSTDNLSLQAP